MECWQCPEEDGADGNHAIINVYVASIIQSCGPRTPHLWTSSLPEYAADLHCRRYAKITGEKILLGNFPSNA